MVSFTALALQLLLASVSLSSPVKPKVQLPPPTGPYKNIGTFSKTLTDSSRLEQYGPKTGTPRRVVVQAFYPISTPPTPRTYAKYGSDLTLDLFGGQYGLPNGTFSSVISNSYTQSTPSPLTPKDGKLVPLIFSTGFGVPRPFYTTFYEQLASEGYFIVAIDNPYDAVVVEFPEGGPPAFSAVPNVPDDEALKVAIAFLDIRVEDAAFVASLLPRLSCASILDLNKIGMFGHSLGGATSPGAISATANKKYKIRSGINMDGTIPGGYQFTNIKAPFLIMGTDLHNSSNSSYDPTWAIFEKAQTGWVREVLGQGFRHGTYTDMLTLVELLKLGGAFDPAIIRDLLGSVEAKRARESITAFVKAFFDWTLKGKNSVLLQKDTARFPEMKFLK